MKHCSAKLFPILSLSLFAACGSDSSSSATEESSSSVAAEEPSSSSYSNRLDADYADTLSSDTLRFSGKDSVFAYKFFLGEYPKGTLIRIYGQKNAGSHLDSFFVKEEKGEILIPEYTTMEDGDEVFNTQNLYARLGDSSGYTSTAFVTTSVSGFYYVDFPRVAEDSPFSIRIAAEISPAHFAYTGDSSELTLNLGDTVRGVFFLGNGTKQAVIRFTAAEGKSINVNASGKSLSGIELFNGKTEMASGASIDEQILPEASSEYSLVITPRSFPDYTTGPYAYFDVKTSSRDLIQGEYFANPDSIEKVGDTLTIVRERNDAAKYYLRQEQYVWLSDLEKGDTVNVYHGIEGYMAGAAYPATYQILDAAGDTVHMERMQFVAKSKGAHYLHYIRLNSPPTTDAQTLTLKTAVQRLNYVTRFSFFDEERETDLASKTVAVGDTLRLSSLYLRAEPSDVSNRALYFIPCGDLPYIATVYTESSCKNYGTEQAWGATNVVISDNADNAGEIIRLIAQSTADPRQRDTLQVYISER